MKTYSMELFENEVHQVRKLVSFIYCPMHGEATVFIATPGCNVAHRFNYSVFAKLNNSLIRAVDDHKPLLRRAARILDTS